MKYIVCLLFGHKRRVIASMPAVFASEPDLFTICKCDRCGHSWPEPPGGTP